tara:strand:- start:3336 stop:4628 length:1293 start_codon:yes stop_codon:yes gene_type:complete
MIRLAIVAALTAALVALVGPMLSSQTPTCPHDPAACYFSDGYSSSRMRFRAAALGANATLHTLTLPSGNDLTIDVAVLSPGTPSDDPRTLVHMSGTHGVEAYAGSAVQLALLEKFTREPSTRRGARIVLVHAVNPFGFRCGRRFNEDNIDLNRNLLDEAQFAELRDEKERVDLYDAHEWLFNMRKAWTPVLEDLRFAAYAIYGIGVLGSINVKRAVVAGQYHQPDGLYYGGAKLAASHALLLPKLREVATPASAAIMLDVHTGLGPTGVDTLIPSMTHDGATPEATHAAIHRIFGRDRRALGTDFLIDAPTPGEATDSASAGYDLTKGTTGGYPARIGGWQRALHITQEFGTVAPPLVLRGMVIERAEWRHRPPAARAECPGSALGANHARDTFYVRTADWQAKVVRRGVQLAEQALKALEEAPSSVPAM